MVRAKRDISANHARDGTEGEWGHAAQAMFKLHTYFSKASVAALILTAILIGLLYHATVDEDLRETARGASAMLVRSIVNRIEPEVHDIGMNGIGLEPSALLSDPRIHALAERFTRAMRDLPVRFAALATEDGRVLYSTDRERIGQGVPPAQDRAIRAWGVGGAAKSLGFTFHQDNRDGRALLTTVAPLTVALPNGRGLLFLLTQDVNGLFSAQKRRQRVVLCLGGGIFLVLYLFLFQVVRRGERVLTAQREEVEGRVIQRTRELRDSQERMADVAEASSDWFWESGPDHRFTWFSLREQDRGQDFDPKRAFGLRRRDLIDLERTDSEALAAHLDDLENHRPFRDFAYWGRQPQKNKGGREAVAIRLIRVSGKPRFGEAGQFLGYRGSAADITEQKEAEDRARRAERRLSEAIDGIPDGFALWDKEDHLVLWNRSFASFFPKLRHVLREGFPFEEAVRLNLAEADVTVSEIAGPGWRVEGGALAIQNRMRRHREANGAVELREASGRWVLITERRVADGQILSIYSDITQRKAMELELAESEAGLRAFLGITSDTSLSFEDRFRRLLEFGVKRFGLTNGVVLKIQDNTFRLVHGIGPIVDIDRRPPTLDESLSGLCVRTMGPLVLPNVEADPEVKGLPRAERLGMRAFLGMRLTHRSTISGVLSFFDDHPRANSFSKGDTHLLELMAQWVGSDLYRRDSELAIRSAMEQAKLANRAKSEFLANMSHELRTPLNAIIGFSEVMKDGLFGPLGSERYREYARGIHDSGNHLLAIINDILDVAKIEAGHVVMSEEEVALAPLIDATLRLISTRAREGGVRLVRDLVDPSPWVRVDGRRMKQVLINVLSNAVKFTPRDGEVRVSLRNPGPGRDLNITVSDTGVGMAEEEIRVALSPFGQIDSGLARRHEGTGLGLPLAKSLMDIHGGSLTLHSAPARGTVVTLTLPWSRVMGDASGATSA
ncbi:MAG: PAS-domain containing protein [Rhodospirillum sp.]|nr:PAS-domain containing protein [Rhodospirillum sp.]MCF8489832.1 PAS-domain containing protein [Rhodospirillum sp.]MCF8499673.1 PAS-domain containing protein [Rhodospirillum sp.]